MSEYVTLVFRRPISDEVRAMVERAEWIAATHSNPLHERDELREKMDAMKARKEQDEDLLQQALDALHEIHWSNDSQWQSERAAPLIDLLKERLK